MYKLDLEKEEEPEIKLPTSAGSLKKKESSMKNIYFCFIDYGKALNCVDHNKLCKILQGMGIPEHITCFLWHRYAGQEATVRIRHGTMDCFQTGKGVHQGCILLPCLFNLFTEYIMWNARLDDAQAWIKTAKRSTNDLKYADDNGRKQKAMAESKEEQKSL